MLQGLETKISCMNDVWAGFWARDLKTHVPELIIYSKSDIYVPYKHIEVFVCLYDLLFVHLYV